MRDKRTISEILIDNLCDMTGEIERTIEDENDSYKDIVDRINIILNSYPRIGRVEFADSAQTFELAELKAMHELNVLKEAKRAYEEQAYYKVGIRDCFEFIVPLLNLDIKKIEEKIKCQ